MCVCVPNSFYHAVVVEDAQAHPLSSSHDTQLMIITEQTHSVPRPDFLQRISSHIWLKWPFLGVFYSELEHSKWSRYQWNFCIMLRAKRRESSNTRTKINDECCECYFLLFCLTTNHLSVRAMCMWLEWHKTFCGRWGETKMFFFIVKASTKSLFALNNKKWQIHVDVGDIEWFPSCRGQRKRFSSGKLLSSFNNENPFLAFVKFSVASGWWLLLTFGGHVHLASGATQWARAPETIVYNALNCDAIRTQ